MRVEGGEGARRDGAEPGHRRAEALRVPSCLGGVLGLYPDNPYASSALSVDRLYVLRAHVGVGPHAAKRQDANKALRDCDGEPSPSGLSRDMRKVPRYTGSSTAGASNSKVSQNPFLRGRATPSRADSRSGSTRHLLAKREPRPPVAVAPTMLAGTLSWTHGAQVGASLVGRSSSVDCQWWVTWVGGRKAT